MKKALYIFLIIFFTFKVYSQKELSLNEAIQIGLSSNGEYKGDSLGLLKAVADYKALDFDYYPQITGQFQVRNNIQRPTTPFPLSLLSDTTDDFKAAQFGTSWNSTLGLSIKQKILDFSFFSNQKIKATDVKIASFTEKDSRHKIAQSIKSAYFKVLLNKELAKFSKEDSSRAANIFKITKSKFEQNTVLKTDLNNATINLRNIISARFENEMALENAYQLLKSSIGSFTLLNEQLILTDLMDRILLKYSTIDTTFSDYYRSDIRISEQQQIRLDHQIEYENRLFLPVISLEGFWGENNYTNGTQPIRSGAWFGNSYVAVNLEIPITSNLAGIKRVESLKAERMQKYWQSMELIIEAGREISDARTQIRVAKDKLETAKFEQKLRQENYDILKKRYEQAQSSFTDLLDAENELQQSEQNYVQSIYNLLSAYMNYENATGTDKFE